MGRFVSVPRIVGFMLAPFEVIAVVILIGLGVLLLLAIEFGLWLRGKPVRELLSELREQARLLGDGATQQAE
jgi:hypothetical protein